MLCQFPSVRRRYGRVGAAVTAAAVGAIVLAAPSAFAAAHPVHVSSTQVELSRDERSLEVTVRLFTDDLEEALKASGRPVSVRSSASAAVDSALSAYLGERLQFSFDDSPLARGRLVGHEREDDATLVYVEVPLRSLPTRMTIVQRVLLELFDDQTNLLHLKFGTKKRSALLRRGNERTQFVL